MPSYSAVLIFFGIVKSLLRLSVHRLLAGQRFDKGIHATSIENCRTSLSLPELLDRLLA